MLMFLFLMIMVLLSIALYTLLERKILSYMQIRKGPNKVIMSGLIQPVLDGIKLFLKEFSSNMNINKIVFNMFPGLLLLMMLIMWSNYTYLNGSFINHGMLSILAISGMGVYGILGTGYSSNSKYSLLGCYRNVAQVISYEVGMIFILISFFMFCKTYNIKILMLKNSLSHYYFLGFSYLFLIWFMIMLAELNRAPFDFAESESELVSGFNIEYGGLKFAFLFLSEYGNMIFMSYFTSIIFFSNSIFITIMIMIMMVWIRGSYPRYRYDNLMYLNWKIYLPLILTIMMFLYTYFAMML